MSGNTLFWFLKNSNIMYLWLRDRFWMFAKMLKIKTNQHQIRKKRSLLQYKLLYIKCSLNVWLLCFVSWSSLCSYFRWNISQTWLSRHKLPLIYRKNRSLIGGPRRSNEQSLPAYPSLHVQLPKNRNLIENLKYVCVTENQKKKCICTVNVPEIFIFKHNIEPKYNV